MKKLLIAWAFLAYGIAQAQNAPFTVASPQSAAPAGAVALGYLRRAIYLAPTTSDISYDSTTLKNLYSGNWYGAVVPASTYSMVNGVLTMNLGGVLTTETRQSRPGALPLLLGSKGFYVEFAVTLSDNNADHFPAVWLMPQEHNTAQSDYQQATLPRYERWMELDVNEGGTGTNFSGAFRGAVINWWGTYPTYDGRQVYNNYDHTPIDVTVEHVYGASYDPIGQQVTWWLDGAKMGSQSTASFPSVINSYHYYLIMNAASRGAKLPYQMRVRYFSAWTP